MPDEALHDERHAITETTMLPSLIRMIQAFRDYRRNVAELSALSNRELADIGLDRSDIPRVARQSDEATSEDREMRRNTEATLGPRRAGVALNCAEEQCGFASAARTPSDNDTQIPRWGAGQ